MTPRFEHLLMLPGNVAVVLDDPNEFVGKERVLVKPDIAKGDSHFATVIAVSDEGWIEPGTQHMQTPKVAPGTRVLIGRYTTIPIELEGVEVHVIKHRDILAKLLPLPPPAMLGPEVACAANH